MNTISDSVSRETGLRQVCKGKYLDIHEENSYTEKILLWVTQFGRRMLSSLAGDRWNKEGKVTGGQLRVLLFKLRNKWKKKYLL